ncbi:MAG: LytTR family transcriptional regulator [Defluviitaleaceae bacterium]|nr:LytTR family transcriptional regulator [Defluviitaleaceae bacterium]
MRVEIKIDPDVAETSAVIYAPKMTPELMTLVEVLEGAQGKTSLLVAKNDDKLFVIEPDQVDIIRAEGGEIKVYNNKARDYLITKPLHEILESLPSNFVRISKSAIVNIGRVDHLSSSFNGTMHIVMKNGINDYISRKYLGDFKKRLGM